MPRKRHGAASLAALLLLTGAGAGSWYGATRAADYIEMQSGDRARLALEAGGFGWAGAQADGLALRLTGIAPDEIARFHALAAVAAVVAPDRIDDRIEIAEAPVPEAPDFAIELLRNEAGISLIGLVPKATARGPVIETLQRLSGQAEVSDLLQAADFPPPEGWAVAVKFGLRAAAMTPRAKISITPGHVTVAAIADSAEARQRLEGDLMAIKPASVTFHSEISAPRPVIAPFALRMIRDEDGARFESCAAGDDATRALILDAAAGLGIAGAECALGLGAPEGWGQAATASIAALGRIGAGRLGLSDERVELTVPDSVASATYDREVAALQTALPVNFVLTARREAPLPPDGPVLFTASRPDRGPVILSGRVSDEAMRKVVANIARAHFGEMQDRLILDPGLPERWNLRVIAALEAADILDRASVEVAPDIIRIGGISGMVDASERIVASLADRLGPGTAYELSIGYDKWRDGKLALPDGATCAAALNDVMAQSAIGFEPGGSEIAGDPAQTLARLQDIMTRCADYRLEIGGHTDSQGGEDTNLALSQARAERIMQLLQRTGIDTINMTARGYGETEPIDSNDTPEGREANRRIEFRLLADAPVQPPVPPTQWRGETIAPARQPAPDPTPAPED